ncbi:choline kinase [Theileria orientalis]|uniref:ethanolamine kinase n=1 Tax=Theileria orientalis TaxID=68886 RepID=A0A976SJM1_THEOR|nr:choline kinase [Theileria orientalis]
MINLTGYNTFKKIPTNIVSANSSKLKRKHEVVVSVLSEEDSKLIKDICVRNIPFWNNVNYDDIEIKIAPNSVSNFVFFVKLICANNKIYPNRTVVLKKRTSYSNVIYDREHQCDVAQLLGDNGLGPRVIGRFSDFTIQEFIEGTFMDASSFQNLSVITSLASSLAKFHKKGTEISPADWDRTPLVFRQINKWSDQVKRIIKKHDLDFDFDELQSSFEIYKTLLENHIKTSNSLANSILFCHNDLYMTNLINFQQGIYFIDFDYAGYNYVGWEVSCFVVKAYSDYNEEEKSYFYNKSYDISYNLKCVFVSIYLSQLFNKNVFPSDNVVKEFLDSLEVHTLGVHLFWTYWGIIM